ncbi:CRISPR-associated endonuclease/helicase Cas3 [Kocuria sp. AG109]|uniref:CRISPR-associated helicase/endonuclease Cas3 n=1 Tax=Rothia kristinae TaxID=37923 RepID=UPI000C258E2C|nr:CRISPR-associated helicase/endonuclease Cas3 [Rothia kristinae]MCA1170647.1 CRISPR-associated helicase Cas3' [Rothia kristinae]MED6047317.1 CRISPR-associated helicase/endonuclease Cas3 [Rothia kristinae]TDP52370.1 CRISPR-associated endonuclease/helicase Cas3 [Kocuria sp. AG109]
MTLPAWSPQATALWAKSGDESGFLSLPQHLMDTGAVAGALWDRWVAPGTRRMLAEKTGLTPDQARTLVIWLAGVHDVGKATPPFQSQISDREEISRLCDRVRAAGLPLPGKIASLDGYLHGLAGEMILIRWLSGSPFTEATSGTGTGGPLSRREKRQRSRSERALAAVVGAHHGLPNFDLRAADRAHGALVEEQDPAWWPVQDELLDRMTALTSADGALSALLRQPPMSRETQMVLTGIVIVADWIASNADLHPFLPGGIVHSDEDQQQRIDHGSSALRLPSPWMPEELTGSPVDTVYRRRFSWPAALSPRPLQRSAFETAAAMDGPGILCIEGPMGVGKTEAALVAAEVLGQRSGAGGLIFAAPTMATSDALFSRVHRWAQTMDGAEVLSMYLGHSKNTLNRDFQAIRNTVAPRPLQGISEGEEASDAHAEVVAHQWLWGRKKGILADFVVGTVDQVLFLALQAKHAMLRHLGLASKVVIIDEVHAYDTYMSGYLARTLEWLGAYGAPVILLSATLPHEAKAQLVSAYQRGLTGADWTAQDIPDSANAYPVITAGSSEGITLHEVPAPTDQLPVELARMPDHDDALRAACTTVREEGGCLLILCNTVSRAQHAYRVAQEALGGEDVDLLHARFIAADRIEKERDLVEQLGPAANRADGTRPTRRIVVATQVVEQSLDLDFDAMITDIAPADLLLQRMGRVHRHQRTAEDRPGWAQKPTVRIRGFEDPGDAENPPRFADALTLINPEQLLLATCLELRPFLDGGAMLQLPEDIPGLVQRTYGLRQEVPAGWRERWETARDQLTTARAEAENRARTYQFPAPQESPTFENLWSVARRDGEDAEGEAQVRDSDPTLEVILVRSDKAGYTPLPWLREADRQATLHRGFAPDRETARLLATSTVRLPHRFSLPRIFDRALKELEETTDEAWQEAPYLKGQLQLTLDEDFHAELAGIHLRYDRELGLLQETDPPTNTRTADSTEEVA